MNLGRIQSEMIYQSLLLTLRSYNIDYDDKHEQLLNEILDRHEAVDLLDLLDGFYNFIVAENDFNEYVEE